MYTNGIRKIFTATAGNLEQSKEKARAGGYKAMSFNGVIFVQSEDRDEDIRVICPWVKTCFQIEDFEC